MKPIRLNPVPVNSIQKLRGTAWTIPFCLYGVPLALRAPGEVQLAPSGRSTGTGFRTHRLPRPNAQWELTCRHSGTETSRDLALKVVEPWIQTLCNTDGPGHRRYAGTWACLNQWLA